MSVIYVLLGNSLTLLMSYAETIKLPLRTPQGHVQEYVYHTRMMMVMIAMIYSITIGKRISTIIILN